MSKVEPALVTTGVCRSCSAIACLPFESYRLKLVTASFLGGRDRKWRRPAEPRSSTSRSVKTHLRTCEHEFRKSPDERIHAVRRAVIAIGRVLAHLVLELGKRADVRDLALFVQRGDRLGARQFSSRRTNGFVGHHPVNCTQDALDKISAVVDFGKYAVAGKLLVRGRGAANPAIGREAARAISQHIPAAINAPAAHHIA